MIKLKLTRIQAMNTWFLDKNVCPGNLVPGEPVVDEHGSCGFNTAMSCEECRSDFLDKFTVKEKEVPK